MFTHTFTSPGTYTLKVAAENSIPADYDLSNNSASATINIKSADNINYYAEAGDSQYTYTSQTSDTEYQNGQMVYLNNNQYSESGWMQYSYISFNQTGPLAFPLSATVTEAADASPATASANFANITADSTYSYQCHPTAVCAQSQAVRSDANYRLFISVWSVNDTVNGNSAGFSGQLDREAGDVTYISNQAYCQWWSTADAPCPGNTSYYTSNQTDTWGTVRLGFGTQDIIQFSMTDAGGNVYSASPIIPLSNAPQSFQQPYTCSNWGTADSGNYGSSCSGSNYTSTGTWGSVTWPQ